MKNSNVFRLALTSLVCVVFAIRIFGTNADAQTTVTPGTPLKFRPLVSNLPALANQRKIIIFDQINKESLDQEQTIELLIDGPDGRLEDTRIVRPKHSVASGSLVSALDLSSLRTVGKYSISIPARGNKPAQKIISLSVASNTSYLQKYRDNAWGAFYWITDTPLGPYKNAHLQDEKARVFGKDDKRHDVRGGWFDAGDYGKYSVNGAYSVSLVLLTALHAPEVLTHSINPLAGKHGSEPDWLVVVETELQWLLKMQAEDGSVHHKAVTRDFPSMRTSPQTDDKMKWVMPPTSTATANFAAVMDLAALVYEKHSVAGSKKVHLFERAASRAHQWLAANPTLKMTNFKYGGYEYGGPYHDDNDSDERFFATAARAALTKNPDDIKQAIILATKRKIQLMNNQRVEIDWRTVDLLGFWSLKLIGKHLADLQRKGIDSVLERAAKEWSEDKYRSPWRISIPDTAPFYWGSNGVLATAGWHWLLWARTNGNSRYIDDAHDQLNWFFGRNPLGKIFITGDQPRSVRKPHFRPWSSSAISLPSGLVVGGANSGDTLGDSAVAKLAGKPPMRIYADEIESYATNEVAINWQTAWALYLSLAVASNPN